MSKAFHVSVCWRRGDNALGMRRQSADSGRGYASVRLSYKLCERLETSGNLQLGISSNKADGKDGDEFEGFRHSNEFAYLGQV